jgi:hypothetical protein
MQLTTCETNQTNHRCCVQSVFTILAIWVLYVLFYSVLKEHAGTQSIARYFSSVIDTGLMLTVTIFSFWLWNKASFGAKVIFGLYAIRNIFVFLDDLGYHFTYDFLHMQHGQISNFLMSTYNVPYLIWLTLLFVIFAKILPKAEVFKRNKLSLIPIIVIAFSLLFVFLSISTFSSQNFGLDQLYTVLDNFLVLANFMMAMLCMSVARTPGLFYFSFGYLITMAADIVMEYGVFAQSFGNNSFMESIWILGSLFILFGLINFKRTKAYLKSPSEWVNLPDSLQSQCTLWMFLFCNLAMAIFLATVYINQGGSLLFF